MTESLEMKTVGSEVDVIIKNQKATEGTFLFIDAFVSRSIFWC